MLEGREGTCKKYLLFVLKNVGSWELFIFISLHTLAGNSVWLLLLVVNLPSLYI